MRSEVEPELLVHATRAGARRAGGGPHIQLGGHPVLNPADWTKHAECAYEAPTDPYIEVILNQNLSGERCAIERYQQLAASRKARTTPPIRWRSPS
jgi:bacterioferritin